MTDEPKNFNSIFTDLQLCIKRKSTQHQPLPPSTTNNTWLNDQNKRGRVSAYARDTPVSVKIMYGGFGQWPLPRLLAPPPPLSKKECITRASTMTSCRCGNCQSEIERSYLGVSFLRYVILILLKRFRQIWKIY